MSDTCVSKCHTCLSLGDKSYFLLGACLCGSEDVFPYRLFACPCCGFIAEQEVWFADSEGDRNPIETEMEPAFCSQCNREIPLADLLPLLMN